MTGVLDYVGVQVSSDIVIPATSGDSVRVVGTSWQVSSDTTRVKEIDGAPDYYPNGIEFPNGTVSNIGGFARFTPAGAGAETDPVVGGITGIAKADGAGNISLANPNIDYAVGNFEVSHDGVFVANTSTDLVANYTTGLSATAVGQTVTVSNDIGTITTPGIVSFDTANFENQLGRVSIKTGGVNLADEVTGTLPVANGGTGAGSLNNLITLTTHTTGNYVGTMTSGDGVLLGNYSDAEGSAPKVSVDLITLKANALSATIDSASGLEFVGGKMSLLQGCADNEILKWDETQDDWNCEGDVGGAETDPVVGAINGIVKGSGAGVISAATEADIEAVSGALFGASKVVTAGYIWVADGADFESVPMTGDVSIAAGGSTVVANDSHTHVAANISNANAGTDITADLEEETHAAEHAVSAADTVFPADPGADKYLQWDDDPGALAWKTCTEITGSAALCDGNDADTGGATAWSSIGDAAADGSIAFSGTTQTISGDTNDVTAITQDLLYFTFTNDAATDILVQRMLVLDNLAGANGLEVSLAINNADADDAIVKAIEITSAAGGITTAIDVSDAEIVTALALGSNDTTVGGVTISSTEFSYLDGVTSAIQTQIGAKTTGGTLTDEKVCTYESTGTQVDCNESETGTGNIVRATSPTLTTPNIGAATAGGTLTLGENEIILDSSISGDGEYSGITEAGTAGDTLAFGDLIYLNNDDSRWELTDANLSDGYDKKIGICVLAAAANGDPTTILLYGKVNAATVFPALTIGAPAYISETAGDIVTAQPTTTDAAIRIVGFANTADELMVNPSDDYITHV